MRKEYIFYSFSLAYLLFIYLKVFSFQRMGVPWESHSPDFHFLLPEVPGGRAVSYLLHAQREGRGRTYQNSRLPFTLPMHILPWIPSHDPTFLLLRHGYFSHSTAFRSSSFWGQELMTGPCHTAAPRSLQFNGFKSFGSLNSLVITHMAWQSQMP